MIIQVDITKDMLEEAEHMTAENKAMFGIGGTHRKDVKRNGSIKGTCKNERRCKAGNCCLNRSSRTDRQPRKE